MLRSSEQLPSKQSVDGSNPSGGVSDSKGSWRKLGAVFILRAQTGAQNVGLSGDSRTGFNVVNRFPITASLSQVLALLELSLLKSAAHTGVAVSVDSVGEPRTRNADLSGVAALDHAVISVAPFLHCQHHFLVSTPVLLLVSRRHQQWVWRTDWRTFVGKRV